MASGIWSFALAEIARGNIDYLNDDIRALLVDNTFTPNHGTPEYLDDILAGARIGDAVALAGKTISDAGILDANDTTITNVPSSETVEAVVAYKHTGVESTSPLIVYQDVGNLVTDGNNVLITWDANGIFDIG